jgi:hypothetical protein
MNHEHGDHRRYRAGCRCRPCTDAIARRAKALVHAHHNGTWTDSFTDASPTRDRLAALRELSYGWREISAATGISDDVLRQIAQGRPTRPAPARILATTEQRILAMPVNPKRRPPRAIVDGTGSRRRLQALAVHGWTLALLSGMTGITPGVLCDIRRGAYASVRVSTHVAITSVYERIGSAAPAAYGIASKDVVATANRAARLGWSGPEAWDEQIDDPAATPTRRLVDDQWKAEDLVAEAEFLRLSLGLDRAQIAERLGLTRDAIDAAYSRARKYALRDLADAA